MEKNIRSGSAENTFALGAILGGAAEPGDVIALTGDLGTGKTCLTQGIARGLGVPEAYAVTSPTFTLINEYPGRCTLYHLDVYRLGGAKDMEDMGYEEYFFGRGVTVVEWAERVREVIPETAVAVYISYIDDNTREFVIKAPDGAMRKIIKALEDGGF